MTRATWSAVGRRSLTFGTALAGAFASVGMTAGVAATVADATPAPSVDAELVRLCGEYIRVNAVYRQADDLQQAIARPMAPAAEAEWNRLDDIGCDATATLADLEDRITALAASTPEGQRAKARVAMLSMTYGHGTEDRLGRHGDPLAFSLARDVAGGRM